MTKIIILLIIYTIIITNLFSQTKLDPFERITPEKVKQNEIYKNRIEVKGWGDSKPIADNNSEESKAKNRRVEFSLK